MSEKKQINNQDAMNVLLDIAHESHKNKPVHASIYVADYLNNVGLRWFGINWGLKPGDIIRGRDKRIERL